MKEHRKTALTDARSTAVRSSQGSLQGQGGPEADRLCIAGAVDELCECAIETAIILSCLHAAARGEKMAPRTLIDFTPCSPVLLPSLTFILGRMIVGERLDRVIAEFCEVLPPAQRSLLLYAQRVSQKSQTPDLSLVISRWRTVEIALRMALVEVQSLALTVRPSQPPDYLSRLTNLLLQAGAGMSPCFVAGRASRPTWARRRRQRFLLNTYAMASWHARSMRVLIRDVSIGGFGLDQAPGLIRGLRLEIKMSHGRVMLGKVAWVEGAKAGFEFDQELSWNDPLLLGAI